MTQPRLNAGKVQGQPCDCLERLVRLAPEVAAAAANYPLCKGLLVRSAGYVGRQFGEDVSALIEHRADTTLIYCQKGRGWVEVNGRLHPVSSGQVVVAPPRSLTSCRGHASNPWSLQWVQTAGDLVPDYLAHLGVSERQPVLGGGEDLEVGRLFTEVTQALERGSALANIIHASHVMGHLLSILILRRVEHKPYASDTVQKVADTIVYMSEHVAEPLRVAALAQMVHLSAPHFAALFKKQTGCAPRDYLHLLRMHHACRMLRESTLSVKETSARVGYLDQFHFSRQFKAFQGISPSEYRQAAGL